MNNAQIIFQDFVQQKVQGATMYAKRDETTGEVLARVNTWLNQQNVTVINIETLYSDKEFVLRVWMRG